MFGIDVSNNNLHVDWSGVEFCFYKATEGVSFVDQTQSTFSRRVTPDGPYHFAHPSSNSPEAESAHFLRHAIPGAMWALDCETAGTVNPLAIMGPDRLARWCDRFYELVIPVLGPNGYHYTFRSFADALWPRLVKPWRWWLAAAKGTPSYKTYAGRTVDIEQYAIVGGVDRNISYTPIRQEEGFTVDPEAKARFDQTDAQLKQLQVQADNIRSDLDNVAIADQKTLHTKVDQLTDLVKQIATGGTAGTGSLGGQATVTIDLKPQS